MNSVMKAAGKDFESIPYQEASRDIWDKKYRLTTKEGEPIDLTMDDTYKRVARALADVEQEELREQWYQRFLWALRHGAIPAGRVTSNAGAWEHKPATSTINCTVSGAIHDSMDDILRRVHEAGLTLKAGCVAPGTWVYTDQGLTTADQAVREHHRQILCYDRDAQRFEMRSILRHMTTQVPREENIRITANGATLTTSIRHPVLIQRDGALQYVRADAIRLGDAMVHHRLPWTGVATDWLAAWLAGARVRSAGSLKRATVTPRASGALRRAQAHAWRLSLKLRA